MSESNLSAFVQRCQATLAEYQRLRAIGVSHDMAWRESGFGAAIMGKPVDTVATLREVRRIVSGETDE